jgi:hypothetical protein
VWLFLTRFRTYKIATPSQTKLTVYTPLSPTPSPAPLSYPQVHSKNLQKSESSQVHKIANVPVVYMGLVLNGFEGGLSITSGILGGGALKISKNLAKLVPFRAKKKSPPPPIMSLVMDSPPPLKTTSYRPI